MNRRPGRFSPCPREPARRLRRPPVPAALLVAALVALCSVPPGHAQSAPAATPLAPPADRGVVTVGFTVGDLDRSVEFFRDVLDFEKIGEVEVAGPEVERLQGVFGVRLRACTLGLGDEQIELTQYLAPEGRPIPADSRSDDRWFQHIAIITPDMDAAYARLRDHGVRHASSGPQRLPDWNPAAGGIEAFYFKDPDGHVLEVLAFPPGKGHPKWRERGREPGPGALFLGIDHTAIVVASTEASLGLYRDALGMTVVGTSENYGPEQERLNNVFGARLRITTLRFPGEGWNGPAVELLEYLAPGGGRPYPADSRANDLWHWQTTVRAGSLESVLARRDAGAWNLVSPGIVDGGGTGGTGGTASGSARAVLVRDPDGHAIRLVE